MGGEHATRVATFQVGFEAVFINYDLQQTDLVTEAVSDLAQSWIQWTPSWGARTEIAGMRLGYVGRITFGTGEPSASPTRWRRGGFQSEQSSFVPAPRGPLTVDGAFVFTHQISVSLPIG
jgi:hypothetical protein